MTLSLSELEKRASFYKGRDIFQTRDQKKVEILYFQNHKNPSNSHSLLSFVTYAQPQFESLRLKLCMLPLLMRALVLGHLRPLRFKAYVDNLWGENPSIRYLSTNLEKSRHYLIEFDHI